MTIPRGFTRCDECEGTGIDYCDSCYEEGPDGIGHGPCAICSGSGLLPTAKLREEAREANREAWSEFTSGATVNDVLLAQADAVLRKVAEHIKEGD